MKTSRKLVCFFGLAVLSPAQPATDHPAVMPRQVVERHIKGMQAGNADKAVEPYADDAVVMTPPGSFPPAEGYRAMGERRAIKVLLNP